MSASPALVQGLKRRIEELEERVSSHAQTESKCRILEEENRKLKLSITREDDPFACPVCMESTYSILPCGHRLCKTCVDSETTRGILLQPPPPTASEHSLKCPVCRKSFVRPYAGGYELLRMPHCTMATTPRDNNAFMNYVMCIANYVRKECKHPFASRSAPCSPRDEDEEEE